MAQQFLTNSFEQTQQLGYEFAKRIKQGQVLALFGDLGSGKTTFVQGFAKGLGINNKIISPSFIIIRTYEIKGKSQNSNIKISGQKSKIFNHIDLYRINDEKDVESLGLIEILNDSENIIAIEWPEKIENLLPENRINLHFEYLEGDKRKITVK